MKKADFKLDNTRLSEDGNHVFKTGLIFRAGNYEDKNFVMTPEEIIDAETSFQAVPVDIEHNENMGMLEGELGQLIAVHASDDGEELYGTAKIPVWLDNLSKKQNNGSDSSYRVSCTWDRGEKKLKKLAIVKNPRVSDAALMAAFTQDKIEKNPEKVAETVTAFFSWVKDSGTTAFADQTYEGKWAMQEVHDSMARKGAICTKPKDEKAEMAVNADDVKVEFVSKEESVAIQQMHDLAIANGAKCSFIDEKWACYSEDEDISSVKTKPGRKNMIKEFGKWLKGQSDDVLNELDEKFSGSSDNDSTELKALKAQVVELTAKVEQAGVKTVEDVKASAESEIDVEKENLKKQVADLQKRNLLSDAEKFAETAVRDCKVLPASKEAVIALFMQAVNDDATTTATEVNFSDDKVCKTRVEVLEAFFGSLDAHKLTTEELATKNPNVLKFGKGADDATDVAAAVTATKAYAEKRNKLKKG